MGTALGRRLAGADLSRTGHEVWGLRRGPSGASPSGSDLSGPDSSGTDIPGDIAPFIADLGDPESLKNLPVGLDFVFYTAAANESTEPAYRSAYLTGLENILAALSNQNQNLSRFFFASSTAVYAQSSGEWVDENSPAEAAHFRGRIMREAEGLALGGPYPATVVRFGGIYGPGRARLVQETRRALETGQPVEAEEGPPEETGPYVNRIHREDCAGIFHHLMEMRKPAPLYVGVDQEPAGKCEVLRWLAGEMRVSGSRKIPPIQGMGKRCSSARIRAAGYTFIHPTFREGYGAILDGEDA